MHSKCENLSDADSFSKFDHLFFRNLPPSQGGRYSGFGNQVESGPPRSSSVTDFYEGSVNGLTSVSFIYILKKGVKVLVI